MIAFAEWLINLDEDTKLDATIALPEHLCIPGECNLDELINWVYPNISEGYTNGSCWSSRAILMAKNDDVNIVNSLIMSKFPGDVYHCLSADTVEND